MRVRAQTPLLQALNYVDAQVSSATFQDANARECFQETVEGAIARPLVDALREVLRVLLGSVSTLFADVGALESCCRVLGHLAEHYEHVPALLHELGAPSVLERALRAHPGHAGVVREALWVLAQLLGARAVALVLSDVALAAQGAVVRASVLALSRLPDCRYPDAEKALPWRDRMCVAEAVVAAIARDPSDAELRALGCRALGSLLNSWAPDAVHEEAVRVLAVIMDVLRGDLGSAELQASAAFAISCIVAGNAGAKALLRVDIHEAVLSRVMEAHTDDARVRTHLASVIVAVEGLRGLVVALDRYDSKAVHNDVMWAFASGFSRGCDASGDDVVATGAVRRVEASLQRWGGGVRHAAVAVLRRLAVLLLAGTSQAVPLTDARAGAARCSLMIVVEALHAHDGTPGMRSEAYEGLAEVALDSIWAREVLRSAPTLGEALLWWREAKKLDVAEARNALLLACALEASVEPAIDAMAEFLDWELLQQAACGALERLFEAEEGAVGVTAARVASRASAALRRHFRSHTCVAVVALLARALPMVAESDGADGMAVLAQGCEDLVDAIRHLHQRSASATGVALSALATVLRESPAARRLLGARPGPAELLASVIRDAAALGSAPLLADAMLALGMLSGVDAICEAMNFFALQYWPQVAGCMALADLSRLGALAVRETAVKATAAVRRAGCSFEGRPDGALQSHAEVALGLIAAAVS